MIIISINIIYNLSLATFKTFKQMRFDWRIRRRNNKSISYKQSNYLERKKIVNEFDCLPALKYFVKEFEVIEQIKKWNAERESG